jgi:hypothetical protein
MPLSFTQAGNLFIAGPNISIYPSGNSFAISGSATSTGGTSSTGLTTATNVGTGVNVLFSSSTTNLGFATLSSQTPSTLRIISSSTGVILFSATTGTGGISGTYVSGTTNIGTGISLTTGITNNSLTLRTFSGSNGMEITTATTGIAIVRPLNRTVNTVYVTDASGNMINSTSLLVDNTNGTLGIGIAAPTTSRLLLAAQTATISPLRFSTSSTNITAPTNGDTWYLGNTLKFYKGSQTTDFIFKENNISLSGSTNRILEADTSGSLVAVRQIGQFGLFNALSSITISNTTAETSCISTSIYGSKTLVGLTGTTPQLVTGKKIRFSANGTIATHSSAGNLTVRMKLGNTVIASHSGFTLKNSISEPNVLNIESTFTIRDASASGRVIGSGLMTSDDELASGGGGGGNHFFGIFNLGEVTVNCNTDQIFDFTFQFSTANASNTITITEATLEYLN